MFERGIFSVFKGLSGSTKPIILVISAEDYRQQSGEKHDRWGYSSLNWGWRRDQLADGTEILYLLDSKTIPDNRHDVSIGFMDFVRDNPRRRVFERAISPSATFRRAADISH